MAFSVMGPVFWMVPGLCALWASWNTDVLRCTRPISWTFSQIKVPHAACSFRQKPFFSGCFIAETEQRLSLSYRGSRRRDGWIFWISWKDPLIYYVDEISSPIFCCKGPSLKLTIKLLRVWYLAIILIFLLSILLYLEQFTLLGSNL